MIYNFKKQRFAVVARNKFEEASKSLPKRIEGEFRHNEAIQIEPNDDRLGPSLRSI